MCVYVLNVQVTVAHIPFLNTFLYLTHKRALGWSFLKIIQRNLTCQFTTGGGSFTNASRTTNTTKDLLMDSPHEGDIYSKQARTSSLENSRDTSLRQTRWLNEKTKWMKVRFNPEVLSSNPVVAYDKLTFFYIILKLKWKSISLDQLKHHIIKCWVVGCKQIISESFPSYNTKLKKNPSKASMILSDTVTNCYTLIQESWVRLQRMQVFFKLSCNYKNQAIYTDSNITQPVAQLWIICLPNVEFFIV